MRQHLNDEQKNARRLQNKAYHNARKWSNIEHIAAPLNAARRTIRRSK